MTLSEALKGTPSDRVVHIKLPCKVGDTVYVPWLWNDQIGIANVVVKEIAFFDSQMHYMFLIDQESDDEGFSRQFGGWRSYECIGETVFFTRKEAKKKLKELQKEKK